MRPLPTTYYLPHTHRGQSALAVTLVIGGIAILIGVTLAILAISFLNSAFGFQNANRAQAIAMSGISDAMVQFVRNKDFPSSSYCVPLGCGVNSATVTITQHSPTVSQATVSSTAAILNYTKRLQAIISIDQTTGLVTLFSLTSL